MKLCALRLLAVLAAFSFGLSSVQAQRPTATAKPAARSGQPPNAMSTARVMQPAAPVPPGRSMASPGVAPQGPVVDDGAFNGQYVDGQYVDGPQGGGDYFDGAPGCTDCGADCGCGDCGGGCCQGFGKLSAGFAFVLVQPHFSHDVAYTSTQSDGATFSSTTSTPFDYDMELAPRVWLELCKSDQFGARITYFTFNHAADGYGVTPDSSQFNLAVPDDFAGVNISTSVPGEVLRTDSKLRVNVFDLEALKFAQLGCWRFTTTGGLRFAELTGTYQATLFNTNDDASDTLNAAHRFGGIGPSISIEGKRPFGPFCLFSQARGALLYGSGRNNFTSGGNLDQSVNTTVSNSSERNDLLPVMEMQLGLEWSEPLIWNGGLFFARTALEGQVWQGFGNPTNENGNLGFFGLNVQVGWVF